MGAIKREMNNAKWTWFAIGYECFFAYVVSFVVYQLASLAGGNGSVLGAIIAVLVIGGFLWLLFRPYKESTTLKGQVAA
jgi:ferrous iron transport protein B